MQKNKIYIACDHTGVATKKSIIEHFKEDVEFEDLGTHDDQSVNYAEYGIKCAEHAVKNKCLGIVICGTGIGISIAANKVKGARCALIYSNAVAELAKRHNDANVLAFGARTFTSASIIEMLEHYFGSEFEKYRHQERLDYISEYESRKK